MLKSAIDFPPSSLMIYFSFKLSIPLCNSFQKRGQWISVDFQFEIYRIFPEGVPVSGLIGRKNADVSKKLTPGQFFSLICEVYNSDQALTKFQQKIITFQVFRPVFPRSYPKWGHENTLPRIESKEQLHDHTKKSIFNTPWKL